MKRKLEAGADRSIDANPEWIDPDVVARDYDLEDLDPTQRVFADRVIQWARELVTVYKRMKATGKPRRVPRMRTWLGGSAGSGKSTTLRTRLMHCRLLFQQEDVDAKIELTAYTGVAAFNIGFGARTAVSSFRIPPKATFQQELTDEAARKLEAQWADVVLLIVDEVSFIGNAFYAKMQFRV